jgi:hypothetical protein
MSQAKKSNTTKPSRRTAAVGKKRPKQIPATNPRTNHVDLVDTLINETLAARGIEAGIFGLGVIDDAEMRSGVLQLLQDHIKRLEEIKDRLVEIFEMNRIDAAAR